MQTNTFFFPPSDLILWGTGLVLPCIGRRVLIRAILLKHTQCNFVVASRRWSTQVETWGAWCKRSNNPAASNCHPTNRKNIQPRARASGNKKNSSGGSPATRFSGKNMPAGVPLLAFQTKTCWREPRYSLFEQKQAGGSPAAHFSSKNTLAGAPPAIYQLKIIKI